jgi:hypothetical protein
MKTISKCLSFLVFATGSITASADTVTYDFTGVVTGATGVYSSAGSTVTGTVTINLAAGAPANSLLPVSFTSQWYNNSSPGSSTRVVVSALASGGVTFSDPLSSIIGQVTNGVAGTGYPYSSTAVPNAYDISDQEYSNGMAYVSNSIELIGGTGPNAPFDANGLPVFANATGGANGILFNYEGGGITNGLLNYTVTSFTPVPLPGSAWLMLSALGGLGIFGRKRVRAARHNLY